MKFVFTFQKILCPNPKYNETWLLSLVILLCIFNNWQATQGLKKEKKMAGKFHDCISLEPTSTYPKQQQNWCNNCTKLTSTVLVTSYF